MNTFTLTRTGAPPLEFRGVRLLELLGADPDGATGGRTTGIGLYRADDGEFVVAIQFRSPFKSEPDDDFVEAAGSESDVEALVSIYSPTERIDDRLFDRNDLGRRRAVGAKLLRRYDEQVREVLESLTKHQTVDEAGAESALDS